MLLHRIADHIKAQNWTAVGLDFVIVVAGVLLAFQIAQWSAMQKDKERAREALHDLLTEAEDIVRELQDEVRESDRRNAQRDRAVAALSAGNAASIDADEFEIGITTMRFYPALSLPRDVYDGLVGSGEFSLIKDRQARRAIAEYYAGLTFFEAQLDYWRNFITASFPRRHDGIRSAYEPSNESRRRYVVDFNMLAADPTFVSDSVDLLRSQIVFQFFRRGLLERAKDMCLAVAIAANSNCKPLAEAAQ